MNSHLKSVGKNFPMIVGLVLFSVLTACVMGPKTKDTLSHSSDSDAVTTKGELSLKKDSDDLAELRKNIPEEKRVENDDLRDTLSELGEVKRPPSEHREKFERKMRAIRDRQRAARTKERDAFNKEERKKREAFLKDLKSERDSFMRKKGDKDEKKEFFDKQESARKEYFADEKDKRQDFESDMRQKENDQAAFYREKSNEFNTQLKDYAARYIQMQKNEAERKKVGPVLDPGKKPEDLNQ